MAEAKACEYFQHSSEWQIVTCTACQYAVWPSQIEGHLKNRQHGMSKREASTISAEVQQWLGVIHFPSDFEVLQFVNTAISGIALWDDGWKCEWGDGECRYVCRSGGSLKAHWRKMHGFSVGQSRGGSGLLRQEDVERERLRHCRRVQCQRFFVQKEHSQFFEVISDRSNDEGASDRSNNEQQTWSQVWERASQYYNAIRADDTIRAGAVDEVNP